MRKAIIISIVAAVSFGLFAGEVTPDTPASELVDVIVHGAGGQAFAQLPADVQHAVRNTLAAHPDDAAKARALAAISARRDVPAQTLEELERVQHPRVLALLTIDARDRGDFTRSEHLASVITALDDPRAVEAYVLLAEREVLSVYEANDRAYALAVRLGERLDVSRFAPVLSNFDSTPRERSIAAFVLAGAHDSAAARAALEKALAHAADAGERRNLHAALTLLATR